VQGRGNRLDHGLQENERHRTTSLPGKRACRGSRGAPAQPQRAKQRQDRQNEHHGISPFTIAAGYGTD
jgi:hypothetical protein